MKYILAVLHNNKKDISPLCTYFVQIKERGWERKTAQESGHLEDTEGDSRITLRWLKMR
jgi:hypothetical protein